MRIVVGIDGRKGDVMAARMLRRLRFPAREVDLVHAVSPVTWWAGDLAVSAELAQETLDAQKRTGESVLSEAGERFAGLAPLVSPYLEYGAAADRLVLHAQERNADLIAVGGHQRRALSAFLAGSVGRGLVVSAPESLLVVKGSIPEEGPIRAVLATDHSDYALRCVESLLAFAPEGIGFLTILTAFPREEMDALRAHLPDVASGAADAVLDSLRAKGEHLRARLSPLVGDQSEVRVEDGYPDEVIPAVMAQTHADLLIVGARGHGWLDRLTLGSVSFHQVVGEPYPVLVLRAPETAKQESETGAPVFAAL